MTHLAYPGIPENLTKRITVQIFIIGVKGAGAKRALILARPNSLPDAGLSMVLEIKGTEYFGRRQYVWVTEAEHPGRETGQMLRLHIIIEM